MKEKKFHLVCIFIALAALLLEAFELALEGVIAAIIALIICAKKKDTHRVKIGVVFAVLAILGALVNFFTFGMIYINYSDMEGFYWLYDLIFNR